MSTSTPLEGTVVAAFGRHYEIRLADGTCISGLPRGKKSIYACGDIVILEMASTAQAQILRHKERHNLLYRSDEYREKLIAANLSQVVLVVATEPSFSDELVSRVLVAAEAQGLSSLIVLNKIDLTAALASARAKLAPFVDFGYRVIELSAEHDANCLLPALSGETSILVGQSGMGKSTLTNALIPHAKTQTREISTALDSGKHTTTHARLYELPAENGNGGYLIDSPGLQEFGLSHLTPAAIAEGFVEFRPFLGHCRFRDCRHQAEPDCAIKAALEAGQVSARRYELFIKLGAR